MSVGADEDVAVLAESVLTSVTEAIARNEVMVLELDERGVVRRVDFAIRRRTASDPTDEETLKAYDFRPAEAATDVGDETEGQ